jgi:hypothetical protein
MGLAEIISLLAAVGSAIGSGINSDKEDTYKKQQQERADKEKKATDEHNRRMALASAIGSPGLEHPYVASDQIKEPNLDAGNVVTGISNVAANIAPLTKSLSFNNNNAGGLTPQMYDQYLPSATTGTSASAGYPQYVSSRTSGPVSAAAGVNPWGIH